MDKQPKLIDANKVQNWIDVEFEKKFPSDCYGYADGRQSILDKLESKINDGLFDPDPIPTIKQGDKVRHPDILEPVTVIWIGEELATIEDSQGNRYDTRISNLEVSHD